MNVRHRKSNRLQRYDYSQTGYYFVTICTQHREELFGEIADGQMVTNLAGEMVVKTWNELSKFYHRIEMDQFQIMPNHVHGIIVLVGDGPRAVPHEPCALPNGQPQGVVPTLSLSNVVHRFKTLTTRLYIEGVQKNGWKPFNAKLWQRSFYDHVIRDEQSLHDVREYIQNNPLDWELDENNPANGLQPSRRTTTGGCPYNPHGKLQWLSLHPCADYCPIYHPIPLRSRKLVRRARESM